jgi:hypothetical protein
MTSARQTLRLLKRQINNREFLKRDPEAQNIVNTLDDRPDEFKTTPPMKEVEVETVEKTELGAEDIPFNSTIFLIDCHYAFYFLS